MNNNMFHDLVMQELDKINANKQSNLQDRPIHLISLENIGINRKIAVEFIHDRKKENNDNK